MNVKETEHEIQYSGINQVHNKVELLSSCRIDRLVLVKSLVLLWEIQNFVSLHQIQSIYDKSRKLKIEPHTTKSTSAFRNFTVKTMKKYCTEKLMNSFPREIFSL